MRSSVSLFKTDTTFMGAKNACNNNNNVIIDWNSSSCGGAALQPIKCLSVEGRVSFAKHVSLNC